MNEQIAATGTSSLAGAQEEDHESVEKGESSDSSAPDKSKPKPKSKSESLNDKSFFALIGIQDPNKKPEDKDLALVYTKNGLYSMITKKEQWTNIKYHIFAIGVYLLLGAQLLLSAVFVILGSLHNVDTHLIIAILGAVGTVIAGTLAFMKGQGQPDRLRRTRNGLQQVRLQAEHLYSRVVGGLSVTQEDLDNLWAAYNNVIKTEAANHPDTPISIPPTAPASTAANGTTSGTSATIFGTNNAPQTDTHTGTHSLL